MHWGMGMADKRNGMTNITFEIGACNRLLASID
jgi:hypothetical protein